jgi:hypothetical protein
MRPAPRPPELALPPDGDNKDKGINNLGEPQCQSALCGTQAGIFPFGTFRACAIPEIWDFRIISKKFIDSGRKNAYI